MRALLHASIITASLFCFDYILNQKRKYYNYMFIFFLIFAVDLFFFSTSKANAAQNFTESEIELLDFENLMEAPNIREDIQSILPIIV